MNIKQKDHTYSSALIVHLPSGVTFTSHSRSNLLLPGTTADLPIQ